MPVDSPTDWFDGNSWLGPSYAKSAREQFMWEGAANTSASYHFASWLCGYVLYGGSWYAPDTTPLQDPLAGVVPAPPSPPPITPTIPTVGLVGWNRSYFELPAIGSAENAISVPVMRCSTRATSP